MGIYDKLLAVQSELKAPKNQYNEFGKYNYRNAEDILEAVKPLCAKLKALVYITDEVKQISDRYYIQATATFVDTESSEKIAVAAYAREEESKKGMDASQVTGAASSYARKYALNGLFAIDDTKDSDATNKGDAPARKPVKSISDGMTIKPELVDKPPREEQAVDKTPRERAAEARKHIETLPTNAEKIKYFAAALGVANSVLKPIVEKYAPGWKVEEMSAVAFNSTLAEIEETAERNESKAI